MARNYRKVMSLDLDTEVFRRQSSEPKAVVTTTIRLRFDRSSIPIRLQLDRATITRP